ncbi:NAD(P)H-binding protein [bacterium]|nr:NAD(P)H-binding protein [bacterium]
MTESVQQVEQLAFVAGATGPTGRAVVDELLARGIPTVAHVRQDHTDLDEWLEWFKSRGAEIDLTAFEQIDISNTLAQRKPSLVFCLLGSNPTRMGRKSGGRYNPFIDGYEAVDNGLATMLMRASSSSGSNPRFILASAAGADETSSIEMLAEKGKAEAFLANSSLRYTGIRIATLLGTPVEERRRGKRDRLLATLGLADESHDITPEEAARLLVDISLDPGSIETFYNPSDYLEWA